MSNVNRLVFPFGLSPQSSCESSSVTQAASSSRATVLASCLTTADESNSSETTEEYVAMGCEDGSLFVFRTSRAQTSGSVALSSSGLSSLRNSPRLRASTRSPSPSLSVSSRRSTPHNAPFSLLTPHARAISNLSRESIEAPKNFVDYDEEEAKLRALLTSSGPVRDRSLLDSIVPHFDKNLDITAELDRPRSPNRSSHSHVGQNQNFPLPNSFGTQPHSSTPKPHRWSIAAPAEYPFRLLYHMIPSQSGPSNAVTCLRFMHGNQLIIALQESGLISICLAEDGSSVLSVDLNNLPRCQAPSGLDTVPLDTRIWTWTHLNLVSIDEDSVLACITASDQLEFAQLDLENTDVKSNSKVVCLQFHFPQILEYFTDESESYEFLGAWVNSGPAAGSGVLSMRSATSEKGELISYNVTSSSTLLIRSFEILPRNGNDVASGGDEQDPPEHRILHKPPLSLAAMSKQLKGSPFKFATSRGEDDQASEKLPLSHIAVGENRNMGFINLVGHEILGARIWSVSGSDALASLVGVFWSSRTVIVLTFSDVWSSRGSFSFSPEVGLIRDVHFSNTIHTDFVIVGSVSIGMFELKRSKGVSDRNYDTSRDSPMFHYEPYMVHSTPHKSMTSSFSSSRLYTTLRNHNTLILDRLIIPRRSVSTAKPVVPQLAWASPVVMTADLLRPQITSILPLDLDNIVAGFSDGRIYRNTFLSMVRTGGPSVRLCSSQSMKCPITSLHAAPHPRTGDALIIASTDDGTIAVWDLKDLALCARWSAFCEPLQHVITLNEEHPSRLKGCMLCISYDGTVAVAACDGFELLYLIPGSVAPLERLFLGSDNLLLVYKNSRTRLWDTKSLEFWRSMGEDKVFELLDQGGWHEIAMKNGAAQFVNAAVGFFSNQARTLDSGPVILLDLKHLHTSTPVPSKPSPRPSTPPVGATNDIVDIVDKASAPHVVVSLSTLRAVLSVVLTFGLDPVVDNICNELGLFEIPSSTCVQLGSTGSIIIHSIPSSRHVWQISRIHTAQRLLAVVLALQRLAIEDERSTFDVISFYIKSLPAVVGACYISPSISLLARYWLDPSANVRAAGRMILGSEIDRQGDLVTITHFDHWHHHLPSLQPNKSQNTPTAALALIITGVIAATKYTLLSPVNLADVSKSVVLYLHDEHSPHRSVAIELASRGFHIWQNYVDAMDLLRSLFRLATGGPSHKDNVQLRSLAQSARAGVLQIASSNSPLFISTISLDIMDAESISHRSSTMHLLAFIIRKNPEVLYPNLPRLVEAVVKSLDPNWSSRREAILDSAIDFLGQVVRSYPSIDFHMHSQRLALGTNEGAVIMYDLKTASRVFVLEGHQKRLSACSFSPDGRRLVTVSLEESIVMVWKVGSSLASFFMPGLPPRQGSSGSLPYKSLPINIGNDVHMDLESTLTSISFEWPSPRSARLGIGQNVFTFATG